MRGQAQGEPVLEVHPRQLLQVESDVQGHPFQRVKERMLAMKQRVQATRPGQFSLQALACD